MRSTHEQPEGRVSQAGSVSNRRGGRPRVEGQPDLFAALADPTRRRLLEQLAARERTVSELMAGLPQSQAAVSQHPRALRAAGLVEASREGRSRSAAPGVGAPT